jgi:hypothetical protein
VSPAIKIINPREFPPGGQGNYLFPGLFSTSGLNESYFTGSESTASGAAFGYNNT